MYILATNNNIYLRLEKSNSEGLIFAIKSIYIKKVIPVFFIFFERFCNTYNWDFVETILFGFIKPTFWICRFRHGGSGQEVPARVPQGSPRFPKVPQGSQRLPKSVHYFLLFFPFWLTTTLSHPMAIYGANEIRTFLLKS